MTKTLALALAGLLTTQADSVIAAYEAQGCRVTERVTATVGYSFLLLTDVWSDHITAGVVA